MFQYVFRNNEYIFYRDTKKKILRLRADRDDFKTTLADWDVQIEQLTRQLYALQTDDIQGIVDQHYSSREDYQSRVDDTVKLLNFYKEAKEENRKSWQRKIAFIELMLVANKAIVDEHEGTHEATTRPFA